jgi:hypothetical protein
VDKTRSSSLRRMRMAGGAAVGGAIASHGSIRTGDIWGREGGGISGGEGLEVTGGGSPRLRRRSRGAGSGDCCCGVGARAAGNMDCVKRLGSSLGSSDLAFKGMERASAVFSLRGMTGAPFSFPLLTFVLRRIRRVASGFSLSSRDLLEVGMLIVSFSS